MKKIKNDTNWIYGLKILAALCVLIHHYALFFFPAFINGNPDYVRTGKAIELKILKTPFNIFSWGGNVCVTIFFIISGFLIYYKFFNQKKVDLKENVKKRYIKLAIPMLFSSIIYFLVILVFHIRKDALLCSNVLGKVGSYCNYKINFHNIYAVFYDALFGFYVNGNTTLNPVLWTMKGEIVGSVCVLLFGQILIKSKNKKLMYAILILLLYQTVFLSFILGMILCELFMSDKYNKFLSNIFTKIILFILGIYFCGFTFEVFTTPLYQILKLHLQDHLMFYHTVGSFLIILVIIKSEFIKRILSIKIFKKYANISFSIYLFHWLILNTISMTLMNLLLRKFTYKISFLTMFFISTIIILVLSNYAGNYIIKLTNTITNKTYKKYFEK